MIKISFAYAYSPRENVGSRGKIHAIADNAFTFGRLKREAGQALCTRRRFWGLADRTPKQFDENRCEKCFGAMANIDPAELEIGAAKV